MNIQETTKMNTSRGDEKLWKRICKFIINLFKTVFDL